MEDRAGALWGTCDPQPMQQVGMFNGPDNQASLMSCHPESPFPHSYWGSDAWLPSRADDMPDIALMSPSLVDPLSPYESVLNLPVVTAETVRHNGQWGQNLGSGEFYPTQDMQDILNSPFMHYNPSALASTHVPQNFTNLDPCPVYNKSFGTITSMPHNRAMPSATAQTTQYGGLSMVPNNRVVTSTNAPPSQYGGPSTASQTSQYGGSSMVPHSMGMFAPTAPCQIINTSGLGGGCNSNVGLMHLPKRQHAHSLPPTNSRDVASSDVGSGSTISNVPGSTSFTTNQKSSSSVMLPPLSGSSHMHKIDAVAEEPKMASFNPGPYVKSVPRVVPTQKQQDQQDALATHRMWGDNNQGKISSSPIPIMGFEQRQQQAMNKSSPVTSLGFEQRQQQAMSKSSPVTNMGFEQRQQQAMSNSSPVPIMGFEQRQQQQPMSNSSPATSLGFEQRQKQPMGSSSPITVMGFEQRQKQPMGSSSPIPIMGFEQRQKQAVSASAPIPNLGFEQRQQATISSSPPVSNMGFEQRQQPTASNSPPLSNLGFEQRQQPTVSNSPPLSNLGFEQRQQQQPMTNASSISNLPFEQRQQPALSNASPIANLPFGQRQQAAVGNPSSSKPDSGESATKWPLRMDGGMGACVGLPGSQKSPVMMQPETGTMKCAIPRNMPISAKTSPAVNANSVLKRPLMIDDNKSNGGSMNKKPVQKWNPPEGCSRLESLAAAAHQKVSQSTSSGRALGPALNTNLKPRARQGSANDPQSIAARVRRERISERLKVLQALIPNGDKVDMVTMLEKAINYVQCLELQIRMLKNDSLWPKALGPLPNTLQELRELAGPEFEDGKNAVETIPEKTKKSAPEVIEFDGNQPSADKE